jgi:predicted DNA-binding transcriptional regulator YafY
MNRTDRLLAIVLELQGKRSQRAEDLARTFETSVRTIYRDIRALGEAGVPLIATPGRGYALIAGYFLPPLSFTPDEAAMLLLGSEVMARRFDAQYRAAAQSAGRKIAGVLPEKIQDAVRTLRERIHVGIEGGGLAPEVAEKLRQLRRAIEQTVAVRFVYHTRYPAAPNAQSPQTREADPYALGYLQNAWYLTGYCHLRHDVRRFRLDRMEEVTPLERTFARPANLPPRGHDLAGPDGFAVRVRFDAAVVRWVREAPSFYTTAEEQMPDGALLVTLRVRQADEVTQWLLGWGRHVRVLEPETLRQRIAAEAAALLDHHAATLPPIKRPTSGPASGEER